MVGLSPVAYEFPELAGDRDDSNWLIIEGLVRSLSEEWSFRQPALEVDDIESIVFWLRNVADGRVAPSPKDGRGKLDPTLGFVEPNIGFTLAGQASGISTLRISLWAESAPPSLFVDIEHPNMSYFIELEIDRVGLLTAATELEDEGRKFPARAASRGVLP